MLTSAVVLVLAQLGFRAWAVFGGWFQFDDFAFMSRAQNDGIGLHALFTNYGGHLMPAGLLMTWLDVKAAPLDWSLPAAELLALQALVDLGAVVFLVSAFGRRRAILAPLAILLFTVLTIPALIWWAAGINQLPFLAALFWGGWSHLRYLRTRRFRYAILTMLITIASLAFYEKTLLAFVLYAFIPLAYFATGSLMGRVRQVVARYPGGTALYAVVALGYLALYIKVGLSFSPSGADKAPLSDVIGNLGGSAYATGVLGGPLRWSAANPPFAVPAPGRLLTIAAVAVLVVFAWTVSRSRARSARAWLLLGIFVACDVVLVGTARAAFVGPSIALDYRYITELAAVSAIALGLATLPLVGAVETVETRRRHLLIDYPARVYVSMAAILALGTYSAHGYVEQWQSSHKSKTYFTNAEHDLRSSENPVPLVDVAVPQFLLWGYAFPENSASHVLKMFSAHTTYPKIRTNSIYTLADDGHVSPVVIQPVRQAETSVRNRCPYPAKQQPSVTVPLDGPVLGTGWWVRAAYYAKSAGTMQVTAGDDSYDVVVEPGLHSLFFEAGGKRFDSVSFTGLDDNSGFCVSEVELGNPVAFERAS